MYLYFTILQNVNEYSNEALSTNNMQMLSQIAFYIIAFVFVAVLAYYSTRLIASARTFKQGGENLQLIERLSVGQQVNVLLVRAGGKYVLIGVSKEHVSFLAELSDIDILEKTAAGMAEEPCHSSTSVMRATFINTLDQLMGKKTSASLQDAIRKRANSVTKRADDKPSPPSNDESKDDNK